MVVPNIDRRLAKQRTMTVILSCMLHPHMQKACFWVAVAGIDDLNREDLYHLLEEYEESQDLGIDEEDEAAHWHAQRPVVFDSDEDLP